MVLNIQEYQSKIFQIRLSREILKFLFRNSIELIESLIIFDRYCLTIDLRFIRLFLVNVDLGFPYWPFHHTVNIRNLFGPSNSISFVWNRWETVKTIEKYRTFFCVLKHLQDHVVIFIPFYSPSKIYRSYKINYYIKGV